MSYKEYFIGVLVGAIAMIFQTSLKDKLLMLAFLQAMILLFLTMGEKAFGTKK